MLLALTELYLFKIHTVVNGYEFMTQFLISFLHWVKEIYE